jgi:hypothetical protein
MIHRWFNRPNRTATPWPRHTAEPLEPRRLLSQWSLVQRSRFADNGAADYRATLSSGIATDSQGDIFGCVEEYDGSHLTTTDRIFEVPAHKSTVLTLTPLDTSSTPQADISVDPAGDLFWLGQNSVYELPASAAEPMKLVDGPSDRFLTGDVEIDDSGDLFCYAESLPLGGVIYEMVAGSATLTARASFNPTNELTVDGNGDVFGVTFDTDANAYSLFELPSGANKLQILAALSPLQADGPFSKLYRDSHGNLFGTMRSPSGDGGSLFELPAGAGEITTLAVLPGLPNVVLATDSAGNLFGTMRLNGGAGWSIFELSSTDQDLTIVASRSTPDVPMGAIVTDNENDLFFTTEFTTDYYASNFYRVMELEPIGAARLAIQQQPIDTTDDTAIDPAISVAIEDNDGNIIENDSSAVTLALASGPVNGLLEGTTTASAIDGVATFSDLQLNISGTYTLVAHDAGLSATSSPFVISGLQTAMTISALPNPIPAGANVVLTAMVSPDNAGPLVPTGSITFFDGTTSLGIAVLSQDVGVEATTTLLTNSLAPGEHVITAHYSGDTTYDPADAGPVTETIEAAVLAPVVTAVVPGHSVVANGVEIGFAVVQVRNETTTPQSFTEVDVFATRDGALDGYQPLAGGRQTPLMVPPGRAINVAVSLNTIDVLPGDYSLIAEVSGAEGNLGVAAAGPTLHVAAPVVSLSEAFRRIALSPAVVADSATRAVAIFQIDNDGNVAAIGNVTIAIVASADGNIDDGEFNTITRRMFIRAGGSALAIVRLRQVPNVPDGDYHIVAHVTDPLSNVTSITSAGTINIAAAHVALSDTLSPVVPSMIPLGRRGVVAVTLANNGNVDSVGPAHLQLGWSSDGVNNAATALDLALPILRIRAGGHLVLHLPLLAVTTLSAGEYFATVSITQNGNSASAVGADAVTLS